ncbi:uridine permease-like protein Fui1 [Meredithblackwellia eburnea MCA 4105]
MFDQFKLSKEELKARCTSIKAWEIPKTDSAFAPDGVWSNADMEPTPPEKWTWTTLTFITYWMSDLVHGSTWTAIASLFSLGLVWWEGLLAIFGGGIFIVLVITMNGIMGARLHAPFAVICRAAYGPYLARFCVISRMVSLLIRLSCFQASVTQMIIAIWPSYSRFPNHLPASSGVTSQEFLSFFLFWLIQFPFCLVNPRNLRPIFLAKGIILPIVAIGTMGWSIHKAGDRAGAALVAKSSLNGAAGFLAFMTAVTAQTGQWATMACNIADFSRYSQKPSSAAAQIIIVPIMWTITAAFGGIATQCLKEAYGEVFFTPFQVIELWQGSHSGRFFAFVCSAAWVLGYIGLNITANSVSASNDICSLFPRWVNILRGQMISVTVGVFAFAPWKVMASGASVVNFATSYSVVLAPIAGIMAADYFFVKKGAIDVPALYDPHGRYRYGWGCNWRAIAGLVCAIGPNVPGMAHALNSKVQIGGAKYIYSVGVLWGCIVGGGVHVALSKLFPDRESIIAEAVYAHEALAERNAAGSSAASEKDKEEVPTAYVSEV